MNAKLKTLVQALVDEINEVKGANSAVDTVEGEWWRLLNWKTPEYKTLFDSLGEDTRILITEAGLCPHCDEEEETEEECEEGFEKNEAGECVPIEKDKKEEEDPPEEKEEEEPEKKKDALDPREVINRWNKVKPPVEPAFS